MALGPIPWTAMLDWCNYHHVARELVQHVVTVMRLVDQETMRRAAARAKKPGGDK